MQIFINDEGHLLTGLTTLASLLEQLNYKEQRFVVAVNDVLIPKSAYQDTWLNDQDRIDMIIPMQGG